MTEAKDPRAAEPPAEIDVWSVSLPRALDQTQVSACHAVMPPGEREAAARFRDPGRRDQAIVARALSRKALSLRLGVNPEGLMFETGENGRPCLAAGQTARSVDFNLAHTEGFVVCAVAENLRIGVDVEPLARADDLREVSPRFLSPSEGTTLQQLDRAGQNAWLPRLWTCKEAYAKALGLGLSAPLQELSFRVTPQAADGPVHCTNAADWSFRSWTTGTGHCLALAWPAASRAPRVTLRDGRALVF